MAADVVLGSWWMVQLICRLTINNNNYSGGVGIREAHHLDCIHRNNTINYYNEHRLYYWCRLDLPNSDPHPNCKLTLPPLSTVRTATSIQSTLQQFPHTVHLKVINFHEFNTTATSISSAVWLTLPNLHYNNTTSISSPAIYLTCDTTDIYLQDFYWCQFHEKYKDSYPPPTAQVNNTSSSLLPDYDWIFLLAIIFILAGGIGNILVCLAISLDTRLHNVTNYFLLSLAIADLLVSLFVMPLGAIQGFFRYWPFDIVWCNIYVSCDVLACSSSIMHMCCISLGRYLGIRNPLKTRHAYARKKVVAMKMALVWVLSILVSASVTTLGITNDTNIMPEAQVCAINNRAFFVFGSLVAFYIPMVIMVVTYTLTVQLLRKKARFLVEGTTGNQDAQMFRRLGGHFRKPKRLQSLHQNTTSASFESQTSEPSGHPFTTSRELKGRNVDEKSDAEGPRKKLANVTYENKNMQENPKAFVRMSNKTDDGNIPSGRRKSNRLKALRLQLGMNTSNLNLRFLPNRQKRRDVMAANAVRTEQKASKVLGLVFFTFVLCWAPFFLLNIAFAICTTPKCSIPAHIIDIALWLGYVSSTINPIIYTIFNRTFRTAFIRLLRFNCHKTNRSSRYFSVNDPRSSGLASHGPASAAAAGVAALPLSLPLLTPSSGTMLRTPTSLTQSFELSESPDVYV